ncbi:MAG: DUF5119 domain-containing protein [Rikenellaceae bacterium]
MFRFLNKYIAIILCAVGLTSCHLDELCYDHNHYPMLELEVDLSIANTTFDELQSYMMIFYPIDDGMMELEDLTPTYKRVQNLNNMTISLSPGKYRAVMYSDYSGQNFFYETDDYDAIYCEAFSYEFYSKLVAKYSSVTRSLGYEYAPEPELLVTAVIDEFEILESDVAGGELSGQKLTFTPTRATHTIEITCYVENITSISSFMGELGKVDSRYYITQQRYNHSNYALLLSDSNTEFIYYTDGSNNGEIQIKLTSFGFTEVESEDGGTEADYAYLYLEFELHDGTTTTFDPFDISEEVNLGIDINYEDLSIVIPSTVELPYVESGDSSNSMGSVSVGDWGDEQIVDIPFL